VCSLQAQLHATGTNARLVCGLSEADEQHWQRVVATTGALSVDGASAPSDGGGVAHALRHAVLYGARSRRLLDVAVRRFVTAGPAALSTRLKLECVFARPAHTADAVELLLSRLE
jgi:hypothetical protein